MSAPGTYRYTNSLGDHVNGEIWSMGPKPKTLWVLGPDGPVVVNVEHHMQVRYVIPTYRHSAHTWSSGGTYANAGINTTPIDARTCKKPVGVAKWNALTASAKNPEIGTVVLSLPLNWGLTLDLTTIGCPTAA